MSISPQSALLDESVAVSMHGLPASAQTTVTASAVDAGGTSWTASAQFRADPKGDLSLSQPSSGGSYLGANPMGLLQFMKPSGGDATDTMFLSPPNGYSITVHAVVKGKIRASATIQRQAPAAAAVTEQNVRTMPGGIYGNLYLPPESPGLHPAVLVFGGSEGGLASQVTLTASLLAAHGYPTLAVAYFGEPGLPTSLANIPLAYFTTALGVLRQQPGVDAKHLLVMSADRGSEAALLLGADFPQLVSGVIAGVPSSVVDPGSPATAPAWTLNGQPVPAVTAAQVGKPDASDNPAAVIPVENIHGPILLACGGQDLVWQSCAYSTAITTRLTAHKFAYPVTALDYADAGHTVGALTAYYSATAGYFASGGGTPTADQAALAEGHAALLKFLAAQ